MPDLESSYRRLLRAYPRFYRRERELEILTTLLDAASPTQSRPRPGEAAHLVLTGLRHRFVPSTWLGRLAVGVVSAWVAVVVGSAAALAVWAAVAAPPPDVGALSDRLAGGPATFIAERPGNDPLESAYNYQSYGLFQSLAAEGWSGARPAPAGQTRYYLGTGDASAALDSAQSDLTSSGWQTGNLSVSAANSLNHLFWAHRDGVLIRVAEINDHTGLAVSAYPVEPRGILAAAIAGFLIGLLATADVLTRLAQRITRAPRPARWLLLSLGVPAVVAAAVNTVDNLLSMVPPSDGLLLAADYLYPLANQLANPLAVVTVALSVGLTALLTSLVHAAPPTFMISPVRSGRGDD